LKNLHQAENAFEKLKENNQLQDTYRLISSVYEKTGKYKKALEYHKRYSNTKDSIYNKQSSRQIIEAQTRYDTLKKEQKIELLEKDAEIKRLDLSRQRTQRNFFIAAFSTALLILILIVKRYLYLFAFWKKEKYVGQYRLQEEIGAGGMGTVYKAHNIKDKKHTVAVKVLKPELFKDKAQRTRFKQEAVIIDKLDHPNIIKIYERGEFRDKMYIAMELLKGKTLDEKIAEKNQRQEHLQLDVALRIMLQTAEALAAIHEKNIVHRDLKPSNIMIQEREGQNDGGAEVEVKLLDFGLARQKYQTRITRTGMIMGTINYMSPEQLVQSEYTTASDIYSLGVANYELITGKIAFPGEFPNDIMKQILDSYPVEPKQLRPEIPHRLNRLIMEMMAKEKEQRPSIKEVKITLDELVGN